MSSRKIFLIIMLVALAASALTGIFAVLTTSGDALWRMMTTAITTAVVTAFLLPLSLLIDRPKLRAGGLTGMGTLLFAWICVMLLTWRQNLGGYDLEERLAGTLGATLLCGLPAAGALLLITCQWARFAAWTFVGLAAYAWLVALAGSWITVGISASYNLSGHLWATATIPYGIGTLCALLLVNLGQGDRRYFRWAGVVMGGVAIVIAVAGVWSESNFEFWGRIGGFALTACLVLAHFNVVLMARLRRHQQWLKWATMACSGIAGVAVAILLVYDDSGRWNDLLLFRFAYALAVAGGCGSIALIILSSLNRRIDGPLIPSVEMKTIQLACPRCGQHQTLPLGEAACQACRLKIITHVVEPRCPACGYNLFRLISDRCPECGAVLADSEKSVAGAVPGS